MPGHHNQKITKERAPMKAKDIQPGVVYGYRRGKYGEVQPIVLLAPADKDHIYAAGRRMNGEKQFRLSPNSTKPSMGKGWNSLDYGYAAAIIRSSRHDESPTSPDVLAQVTLEEFLATELHLDAERGIEFLVVTSASHIVGPYDEAITAAQAERDAEDAARDREKQSRESAQVQAKALIDTLARLGVTAAPDDIWHPSALTISFKDLDKLIDLINANPAKAEEG